MFIVPAQGSIVIFDIVETETHTSKSVVTDHPVEIGSDISDHIRNEPDRISIKGIVSNFPILLGENGSRLSQSPLSLSKAPTRGGPTATTLNIPKPPPALSIAGAISALSDLLFGTPPVVAQLSPYGSVSGNQNVTVQTQTFPATFDNVLDVHNELTAIRVGAVICEVFTSTKAYDNMVIESIEYSKEDAGAGSFSVDLRRIIQVQSAVVAAPVPLIKAGAPPAPKGSQVPKEMSAAEKKSFLKKRAEAVWDLASKFGNAS